MTSDVAEQFDAGKWEFTPEVTEVFDEHVRASVPFYDAIQDLVAEAADWLCPAGSLIADLGASTGTTVGRILDRHPDRQIRAVLYDEQPAMLGKATARLVDPVAAGRVNVHARRLQDGPFVHDEADLTLSLFTLQFLPWRDRSTVLAAAHKASASTGALLVAEKVRPVDPRWAEIAAEVSHDWKATHGITADAIRAKARALRGVLAPAPLDALTAAVRDAGWHQPEVLFRWHQWVLIGAYATPPDGISR
ncbi:methyltransferase domain-containing protein [Verrucosispora sp. TAA-831]|uniref:methyltransferase domain-containing protein n=1 Tax=Verrucosispora sp. TAA-831 TaxID=3422227 RepID=UPI003D6E985D